MDENISTEWITVPLCECGQIVSGGTPSTKISAYWNGDIAWITPADLSGYTDKFITRGRKNITLNGLNNSSARLMPPGSILFSSRAPIGYVAIAASELCTNQGFKSLIPNDLIDSTYLYYFFKHAKRLIEDQASGTTFKEISAKAFSQLSVPIPPLLEQRRIVAKIEELFSELDKGVELLKTLQQQLKIYRQAVLKWAFDLFPETSNLYSMDQIVVSYQNGLSKRNGDEGSPFKVLRLADIQNGIISSQESRSIILKPAEVIKFELEKDDLLIIRVNGSKDLVGVCIRFNEIDRWGFCDHFIRTKIDQTIIKPEYFIYYSRTSSFRRYIENNMVSSAGQNTVSQTVLNKIEIRIPSINQQDIVISEIESRLSVADIIEETIEQTLQQSEALRQSILKKAFEGRLLSETELEDVRNEPDWEPASVLLEKIKAHKATSDTSKPPAKKSARKGKNKA